MNKQEYLKYFNSLGYKISNPAYYKIIVTDFQRHVFPFDRTQWDGKIGPITQGEIDFYDKDKFCPEVFEPIKPYKSYTDEQIEGLMKPKLIGCGKILNTYAKLNDFDVLHSIAHSILESSYKGLWANSAIARRKNNIYGFGAYDSSPMASAKKFTDIPECIKIWSEWWNRNYLLSTGRWYHGNSEYGVNVCYASSPIAGINKSFIVQNLREKIRG